jgi:hypothetical protein
MNFYIIIYLASLAKHTCGLAFQPGELVHRANACTPEAVNIVFQVLKALRASSFCTSWNSVSRVTQTSLYTLYGMINQVY